MKKYYIIAIIIVAILGVFYYFKSPTLNISSDTKQQAAVIEGLDFSEKYQNSDIGFSFSYPSETIIEENEVEGGKIIIVKYPASGSIFQIFIRPISEKYIDITADRLKQEVPDLVFRDSQEVTMGESGRGLAFISKEVDAEGKDTGEKREVWFALGGFLYQLSAPLDSDAFLQKVLNTWEFR